MKNRFNNLTSKEWLPFQKSWYYEEDKEDIYKKNLRFFVKTDHEELPNNILFHGSNDNRMLLELAARKYNIKVYTPTELQANTKVQFLVADLLDWDIRSLEDYKEQKAKFITVLEICKEHLGHRRFLSVLANNKMVDGKYLPIAYDLSAAISSLYTQKDEKIGCTEEGHYYAMYWRKDEKTGDEYGLYQEPEFFALNATTQPPEKTWHILRPRSRSKKEILHPAKYPEELVNIFLEKYTKSGDNVFDPMTGTASTQIAALQMGRNGYGTELSGFFAKLANERLRELVDPPQQSIFKIENEIEGDYKILHKDAREITAKDFPTIDYVITSPPYWDILNMKGAEHQAQRIKQGLQTNYSNSKEDLGNIEDYQNFMAELVAIYENITTLMKPGGYMTIVIKNIKKKGRNYPFAFDLAHLLQKNLILEPEVFWLQDDIRIAPYGYGNTFVSNTFHHYCLTFRKPE